MDRTLYVSADGYVDEVGTLIVFNGDQTKTVNLKSKVTLVEEYK